MVSEKLTLLLFSAALIGLALSRWYYMDKSVQYIDLVLISLICGAFVIHLVPFDKLSSIKAAGIEVALEKPEVKAAINATNADYGYRGR